MPLIARQRSRLAVLAVLALVGSLLAVSAVPVAAEDGKADNKAVFSACVNAATDDAGFTDVDGDVADAANCLFHYGITKGTKNEGEFGPRQLITRVQLALFLARAAGPAGIELLDDVDDQGFTDIGDLSDEAQDAINNLADLEIMGEYDAGGMMMGDDMGKAFGPQGLVSRSDMAEALDAFLGKAILGPGAIGGGANQDKYSGTNADVDPDDTQFTDLRQVSRTAYDAIRRLFEVGVTTGTGDGTTFSPDDDVNRGQMALFITRMLDHTNARPAGLSIQSDMASTDSASTLRVNVSLRNDDHEPMEDAILDIFKTSAPEDAFNDDGTCDVGTDGVDPEGGTNACSIDSGDEITDPDGNLDIDVSGDVGSLKLWAWTGKIGDTYDDDTTDKVTLEVSYTSPATHVKVTDSMREHADALRFGDSITFTFQVVDADENAVGMEDVEITIDSVESDGSPVTTADPITYPMSNNDDTSALPSGVEAFRTLDKTYKTDADGQVEVTFSIDDPRPKSADQRDLGILDLDVSVSGVGTTGSNVIDKTTLKVLTGATAEADTVVEWRDTDAVPTNLVLGLAQNYHVASDDGDGARNTVTATLVDQYGDPVSRAKVRFYSGDENSGLRGTTTGVAVDPVPAGPKARSTNRNGVATQSYSRDSDAAGVEVIRAEYVRGECNDDETTTCNTGVAPQPVPAESDDITSSGPVAADSDGNEGIYHYWGTEEGTPTAGTGVTIVARDTDNNTVVLADGTPPSVPVYIVTYKSIDQFSVINGTDTATGVLASGTRDMAGFVRALKAADITASTTTLEVNLSDSRKTPSTFILRVTT